MHRVDAAMRGPFGPPFVALLVLLVRLATAPKVVHVVWAEDGAVFWADAQNLGVSAVFANYSGYGHLTPRLIGAAAAALPVAWVPAVFVMGALLVEVLCLVVVDRCAARRDVGVAGRLGLTAGVMLVPVWGVESLANAANLQWFVLYAGCWVCLVAPSRARRTILAGAGFLATATSPLMVLMTPALVVHGRRAWRHPVLAGIACGTVFQLVVVRFGEQSMDNPYPRASNADPVHLVEQLARVPAMALRLDGFTLAQSGMLGLALSLLLVALLVRHRAPLRAAGLPATSAAAVFCVTAVVTGNTAPRYVALVVALLISAIALARPSVPARIAVVSVVFLVGLAVVGLPLHPARSSGESWGSEVRRARMECTRHGDASVDLAVAPAGWGSATVTCSTLER